MSLVFFYTNKVRVRIKKDSGHHGSRGGKMKTPCFYVAGIRLFGSLAAYIAQNTQTGRAVRETAASYKAKVWGQNTVTHPKN